MSSEPAMVNTLPSTRVLRTPNRLMLRATKGPGRPDMIMYTENMLPVVSRFKPTAFAMAALITAGPYAGKPRFKNTMAHSAASMVQP